LGGSQRPPAGQRDKLLLVDDDTGVRLTLAALIGLCGYDVAAAASGDEALRLIASGERFVALVTDVHMPEMTGIELVTTLLERGIDLPVLFLSGQADAPLPPEWPASVPRRFLAKPFTPDVLNAALSRLFA
jgi:CheY-like chemotaxis protein